ncbi:hypothetical protein BJY00DRAFT_286333 [Aspergillus carlsbadensis]|nr:hypothetical protein BJY00DRAFT_286333 [Aspergillus carlsbadensis]
MSITKMTSPEFAPILKATIESLEPTQATYNTLRSDKQLPATLHESAQDIQLLHAVLQTVYWQVDPRDIEKTSTCVQLLEACNAKARLAADIYAEIAHSGRGRRVEAYALAVRRRGDGSRVETLVQGMMADLRGLADESAVRAAIVWHVASLEKTVDRFAKVIPEVVSRALSHTTTFSNYGAGSQFNVVGGTQNTHTGGGHQFCGSTFTGPVYFGTKE